MEISEERLSQMMSDLASNIIKAEKTRRSELGKLSYNLSVERGNYKPFPHLQQVRDYKDKIVPQILQLMTEHQKTSIVVKELNDRNILTVTGKQWTCKRLRRYLDKDDSVEYDKPCRAQKMLKEEQLPIISKDDNRKDLSISEILNRLVYN